VRKEAGSRRLRRHDAKPRKKLCETTEAPSTSEIAEILDGPPGAKPVETKSEAASEPDPLDELQPHASASEENRSHFGKLKSAAKEFREKAKIYETKLALVAQKLGLDPSDVDGLVQKVLTLTAQPQLSSQDAVELNYYRGRDALKGLVNSPTFVKQYQQPLESTYDSVLDQICKFLPGDPAVIQQQWLQPLKREFRPTSKQYGEIT
jgi:hypothetical protein